MSGASPLSIPPATFYSHTALSPPSPEPPSWCLTQAEAFARADEHGRPVSFWSRENPVTLRREFSEAAAGSFWPWYRGLPPAERHYYELLRTEGSRRACHLYLDCEYYKEHNTGLDGDALTALLVTTLTHGIKAHGLDVESVVELDSSSATKFSRHLVVRLHDVAFVDNLAAGAFCTALLEPGGRPLDAFVINKPGGTTTFYDGSVYSRNRAFRLYLSSKAGKQVCLLPTARCWQEMRGSPPRSDAELAVPRLWLFLASLASNVASTARLVGEAAPARPLHAVFAPGTGHSVGRPYRGTRYCGNVRRQHRSNGIYIVVDYRDRCFYQKCFDPDCRNYRSEPEPLGDNAAAEGSALLALAAAETARSFDSWLDGLTPSELDALDAH